jgi:DnaK suppressor protein
MRPILPQDYRPSEDEEFMGPRQVEYFRQKLLRWRSDLLADSTETLRYLQEESLLKPDLTDRASLETERAIELRTRDRERKLISKIDAALSRLDTGTY